MAKVERVTDGALVTVTDATGTTTAMLYDATIEAGSVTDEMLAPDGIKQEHAWLWSNQLTGELTGEVLTASDVHEAPLMVLGVLGASEQDGTPTPDAPVDIASAENPVLTFAGRNLFDKSDVTPNRYVNASGGLSAWNAASASHLFPVVPNTSYTLHFGASPGNNRIAFYSQEGADGFISPTVSFSSTSVTFTTPDGARFLRFSCYTTVLDSAQLEAGSTASPYTPYVAPTTVTLPVTLRSLPDGTKDTLALTYLRPSTREGWAWYAGEVTRKTGQTTQASTDGITGTVGVDVMSTTGEIADGPTVVYKLPTPATETLPEIELPILPAPSVTIWATADATPGLYVEYVRDSNLVIASLEAAIVDLATS